MKKIVILLILIIYGVFLVTLYTAFCQESGTDLGMELTDTGFPTMDSMNFPKIIVCTLFTVIGFVALGYGNKMKLIPPSIIGILLIIFPYIITTGTLITFLIGCILTIFLFLFRR